VQSSTARGSAGELEREILITIRQKLVAAASTTQKDKSDD